MSDEQCWGEGMQFCSEAAQELRKSLESHGGWGTSTSHMTWENLCRLTQMNSYSHHFFFFKASHSKVSDDDDMSGLKRLLRSSTLDRKVKWIFYCYLCFGWMGWNKRAEVEVEKLRDLLATFLLCWNSRERRSWVDGKIDDFTDFLYRSCIMSFVEAEKLVFDCQLEKFADDDGGKKCKVLLQFVCGRCVGVQQFPHENQLE